MENISQELKDKLNEFFLLHLDELQKIRNSVDLEMEATHRFLAEINQEEDNF